jgi:hypothetical protein
MFILSDNQEVSMARYALLLVTAVFLFGCTMQMRIIADRTDVRYDYEPKPAEQQIKILEADEPLPQHALLIATLKVTDTGVTIDCGYENVLAQTLNKARELGGDLIQIMQVYAPDIVSSCFRLDVDVYAIPTAGDPD